MNIPSPEILQRSAVTYLRQVGHHHAADLLARCQIVIGDHVVTYMGSTVGLFITLRCGATDLPLFVDPFRNLPSDTHSQVEGALSAILPAGSKIHDLAARTLLVDGADFDRAEMSRLIDAQKELMVDVATGGSRIQAKQDEYRARRAELRQILDHLGESDPNPFDNLWDWYGRWSGGGLPTYSSRREYVRTLYEPLVLGLPNATKGVTRPAVPLLPTGWNKVDRIVDKISTALAKARQEEEFQTIGLLCREAIIALAKAVFDPDIHLSSDGVPPSATDAYRMLEGYFAHTFSGEKHEVLRKFAKAALALANQLQHRTTATAKDASLCTEASRMVINIVAIASDRW